MVWLYIQVFYFIKIVIFLKDRFDKIIVYEYIYFAPLFYYFVNIHTYFYGGGYVDVCLGKEKEYV